MDDDDEGYEGDDDHEDEVEVLSEDEELLSSPTTSTTTTTTCTNKSARTRAVEQMQEALRRARPPPTPRAPPPTTNTTCKPEDLEFKDYIALAADHLSMRPLSECPLLKGVVMDKDTANHLIWDNNPRTALIPRYHDGGHWKTGFQRGLQKLFRQRQRFYGLSGRMGARFNSPGSTPSACK